MMRKAVDPFSIFAMWESIVNIKAPKQTKPKVISSFTACAAIIMTSMFSASVALAAVVNYDGDEPFIGLSTGTEANILSGANIGCIETGPDECAAVLVSGQGVKVNFLGGTVSGDLSWSGGTEAIHEFDFYGGIINGGPAGGAEGSGKAIFTFHGTSLSATCPVNVEVFGECRITGTLQDGNAIDYTISGSGTYTVILLAPAIDLALTVTDAPDPVLAGSGPDNLTHTFELENLSLGDASNVSVSVAATLPAGVTVSGSSASQGSFDGSTWTVGNMPFGSGNQTLDIFLTVDASAATCTDCIAAEGTAAADQTDVDLGNNTAVDPTSIENAADAPSGFLTTIGFTNGYEGMVSVSISCNNGVPLDQTFDISPSQPVDFVVDLLDFVAPDVNCTISLDTVDDGYVGNFLANGVDTGDACVYSSEPEAGEAPFDNTLERSNTCEITAEPVVSTFEVEKVWEFESNDVIEMSADIHIWCSPASSNTGPEFGTVQTWVTAYGNDSFTLQFYPDWDGGATCYAQESDLDSAVESDGGCADGTDFEIGDEEAGCTITNTVFFEGIPTLSQWGMGLMALLMLGVGFVGLRRFV